MIQIEIKSKDIRKCCSKGEEREPCFVCGKHKLITHSHHIMPLEQCAKWMNIGVENVRIPTIWLCPTCHAYIHYLMRTNSFYKVIGEVKEEEYKRMCEILRIKDSIEADLVKLVSEKYGL
jgi:hypothetical protein